MNVIPLTSDAAPYEPLTEREASILALMAEGLSDREIAERLFVAYTTVKWYNRQIFNKLGVDNRRAAIERGRELHLLDTQDASIPLPRHNLPAQVTPFIGREREIADITRLLREPEVRLVTILAPGGMGKTRLALAAAETLLPQFPNGVYFVPLAALSAADSIITAIAERTGCPPQQQVYDYLGNKTALLVLDNFEHLLDGAPLVSDLLAAAPRVRVLATSRERLNLTAETVVLLDGLDYPAAADMPEALACGAVRLFVQGARRVRPDFEPDAALADIGLVCRLVQGMPLAVELAAAWVEVLSPGEIAGEIRRSLDFLQTTMRDVPERLRSVRAVFESTWRRLSGEEQSAFMKLAVFRGGCMRPAAEQVAGATLAVLTALADRSLVWRRPNGRYLEHELLRQYAAEQLEQAGLADTVRDAHSRYYAALMNEREPDIKGRRQLEGLNEIEAEFENIRAAWLWAAENHTDDSINRMLEALFQFCELHRRFQDYDDLHAAACQQFAPLPGEAPRAVWVRLLVKTSARAAGAADRIQRGLDLAREYNDQPAIAAGLLQLAVVAALQEDFRRSVELAQAALPLFRALDDVFYAAESLAQVAGMSLYSGQYEQALACSLEAAPLFRALGHWLGLAQVLWNTGGTLDSLCRFEEAEAYFVEAVEIYHHMGSRYGAAAVAGWHLTWRMVARGDLAAATRTAEEFLAAAIEFNSPHLQGRALTVLGMIALEEEDYERAYELGDEGLRLIGTHPLSDFPRGIRAAASVLLGGVDQAREFIRLKLTGGFYKLGDPLNAWDFDAVAIHAGLLALAGHGERAVEWFGLAGTCPFLPGSRYYPALRAQLQAALGADTYAAAFARGQAMPLTDALRDLMEEEDLSW